jgi:poly-gamma-glutamate synthesis protein (capsule biosynthesis protein)
MVKRLYRLSFLLALLVFAACRPEAAARPPVGLAGSGGQSVQPAAASATPHLGLTATTLPTGEPAPTRTAVASPTTTREPPTLTATAVPTTTLLFTGVIVPARCVQAALDTNGSPDHPYVEVKPVIQSADLAVGVYNATMSHRVEHTGCVDTYQLVGSPQNADALQRAGFDLMNVATNHIKDCGPMKSWCNETFFDTLENLRRVDIPYVGAGKDLEQALQPQVLVVNGVRFGFVALGDSKMDQSVFATETNPGIAHLDEANLRAAIAAARKVSDVVVAMPHWGSEDNYVPNWNQRTQARQLIAAGADLIVGNHTHVVQAIQEIDGIPVFYGLGNFVFDQGLRDHRQGVILLVKFRGTQYAGYELIPVRHDRDGRVHIVDPVEAAEIIENIRQATDLME